MTGFVLFAGEDYYARGGADDMIGCYETVNEAMAAYQARMKPSVRNPNLMRFPDDWAHILDVSKGRECCCFQYHCHSKTGGEWKASEE